MAPRKKKETAAVEQKTEQQLFDEQLISAGLGGALSVADEYEDANYVVHSTGWPGLDMLIGGSDPKKAHMRGWPESGHSEIFSEVEHVGKTSISLGIGVTWQMLGKRVGAIDIEPSMKVEYLKQLGYITGEKEAAEMSKKLGYPIYAVRLLQPRVKPEQCASEMVYVDKVLNTVATAANFFDLLIVDSVDALVSEADAAKPVGGDAQDQMGGVSKPIKSFFRKNTTRRAHVIWINHMSSGLGQYAKSYTTGGKAIPRYSCIRLKLDRVDWIRETTDGDPIGFVTKITTIKNRLPGGIGKSTTLYYIFGEGFSTDYDYFQMAQKMNMITRKGAWVFVGTSKEDSKLTVQGVMNMYKTLKGERRDLFDEIKHLIDGEDVEPLVEHDEEGTQLALGAAAAEQEDENSEPTEEDLAAAFAQSEE